MYIKESFVNNWTDAAFVYHLFPLGALGAPRTNPGGPPVPRIRDLESWLEPAERIGANTLLLGPFWESGSHGYDTHDYSTLDRRLGSNDDLARALKSWKARGFRLVFDAVLNHCGRGFAPFVDLIARGRESPYRDWFAGVDFQRSSPFGDPFSYEGWAGHFSLVKYNLRNPEVRQFLLEVVGMWIDRYDLDGLRLDAADVMDRDFLRELSAFCKAKKPEFWLMGEVVHGDYNQWAPGAGLDAATNYELFKGLWSSHNDANYFELAWTLNRQFGPGGLYRGRRHLTFGDNHDVDRIASTLADPALLYPHAILSASVPGVPAVYYGSEAGQPGRRTAHSDESLRPALVPGAIDALPHQTLRQLWSRLAQFRRQEPALRSGDYQQALVTHGQLGFWRLPAPEGRPVLVVVNSEAKAAGWTVTLPPNFPESWTDLLCPEDHFESRAGVLEGSVWPRWGRILVPN